MMRSIRLVLFGWVLLASVFLTPSWATSWSTDQSDLWWNPNESGWGIQFVQRGNAIFATMFVYDPAGNPTWYVATMEWVGNTNGVLTWSGDLYATRGPWFGTVPFNPATVTPSKLGTMTWQSSGAQSGTLTYSVNAVNVTKSLVRQPIRNDDYNGTYLAGIHLTVSGCANPAQNGTQNGGVSLTIVQNGQAVSLTSAPAGGGGGGGGRTCTYSGTYSQAGQFASVAGTYSCSDGDVGTFTTSEMTVSRFGISGDVSTKSTSQGCNLVGQFGGAKVTP
jgi:hypothetical protein